MHEHCILFGDLLNLEISFCLHNQNNSHNQQENHMWGPQATVNKIILEFILIY